MESKESRLLFSFRKLSLVTLDDLLESCPFPKDVPPVMVLLFDFSFWTTDLALPMLESV